MLEDLIPMVGMTVEAFTPEDKVHGLNDVKTHHRIYDNGVENDLSITRNFKDLKSDGDFQKVHRHIRNKEYVSENTYKKLCEKSSKIMGISTEGLTRSQRITKELSDIANRNMAHGKRFDMNSHWSLSAESHKAYADYVAQERADRKYYYDEREAEKELRAEKKPTGLKK